MPKSVFATTAISDRVERELGGVHRVDVAERVPDRAEAVLERVLEDQHERRDQQRAEVAERDEAHAVADRPLAFMAPRTAAR